MQGDEGLRPRSATNEDEVNTRILHCELGDPEKGGVGKAAAQAEPHL